MPPTAVAPPDTVPRADLRDAARCATAVGATSTWPGFVAGDLGGSSCCDELGMTLASIGAEADVLGPAVGPRWLALAAVRLAGVLRPWAQQVGPPPAVRTYQLLLRGANVEAWLIYWPPGGRLDLHDHGGAAGALRVIDGELVERYVDAQGAVSERRLGAGQAIAFGRSYVHDVANAADGGATSVHVYSSASTAMSFYRFAGPRSLERVGAAEEL